MMLDEKDLLAIAQLLAQQKQEITSELRTEIRQSIAEAEQRISKNTVVLMDAQFMGQFRLLAEGQEDIVGCPMRTTWT